MERNSLIETYKMTLQKHEEKWPYRNIRNYFMETCQMTLQKHDEKWPYKNISRNDCTETWVEMKIHCFEFVDT